MHVSLFLDLLNRFWIVAGLARDGIAPVAGCARKPNRILAVIQGVECAGRAVFVHGLDLPVAGDAAFEPGGLGILEAGNNMNGL